MKLGANLAPTLGSFLQNSVHSFSMGLCVCSLNQAKASVPHGQGPCGMLCIIELSDQVAQATLTSVWVERPPMKWACKGRSGEACSRVENDSASSICLQVEHLDAQGMPDPEL